jgi:alpha-tubulin suppressor-like RCC1 family protein
MEEVQSVPCMQTGQLGIGHFENANAPQVIITLAAKKAALVSCGLRHTIAVTDTAEVYSWGRGIMGQLGHGDDINL